jgi:quinol monooxygenase YgiN
MTAAQLPPCAVVVQSKVADFDTWLRTFNDSEGVRRDAGVLGHHINRGADDPNAIGVYLAFADLDKAKAFTSSPELAARMKESGAMGPPQFMWMIPKREGIVWDREVPSFILSHSVADFDRWLETYDSVAGFQKDNGIIGQAANQSMDDPSLAIVYHQAESFDALRAFLANDELKAIMGKAGVTSAPAVDFFIGGWGKRYV